jgi:hypothetical protein|tara:strand:- start:412 stop:885 length:474 start_codon:yes stop_codon:yes gene_type:complete
MSDFEGVDFITDMPESSGSLDPAPEGTHDAKIIDVEKYKSPNSGNWTCKIVFQIDGGKYRDHTEWYNLWHPNPETKKLSNALFTQLNMAVGFKQYPETFDKMVGKELQLKMYQIEDSWTDKEGNARTSMKTKLSRDGYVANSMVPPSTQSTGDKPPF